MLQGCMAHALPDQAQSLQEGVNGSGIQLMLNPLQNQTGIYTHVCIHVYVHVHVCFCFGLSIR